MNGFRLVIPVFLALLIYSCAIQQPPEGGAKDISPPALIGSSPANFSTNFRGPDIRLDFDEYIAMNDLAAQIIVSPLLTYSPEIKVRKRSLLIHLQDTLLENTTYTMNFGTGIVDNNEGNKLENFQFVFSTGEVIDSQSIAGNVVRAFDQRSEKGILISLYRDRTDSVPYLLRPLYFSRTSDSGEFRISNIAPGEYKIFSIKETDADYLYSNPDEMIAFRDSAVNANSANIDLELFQETPPLRFVKGYSEFPGKAVLVFTTDADTVKWKWLNDSTNLDIFARSFSDKHDSLTIWYRNVLADTLNIAFDSGNLQDTVTLRLFRKTDESSGRRAFRLAITTGKNQSSVQDLHLPFYLQSNRPLKTYDFSKIIFTEDSIRIAPVYKFSDSLHMNLEVRHFWKSKSSYTVFIPPGTLTDIYDMQNDSTEFRFISHGENDYGSVTLKIHMAEQASYIVQLVDEAGVNAFREFSTTGDTTVTFANLDPNRYRVKFIRDDNGNGKWDTGNYLKHLQPEAISFYAETILVRANWDIEQIVSLPIRTNVRK
jgi:hypothetical protein